MKKILSLTLSILMVFTLFAGCDSQAGNVTSGPETEAPETEAPGTEAPGTEAPEDVITMKYAVTFTSTGTQAEGAEKFAQLVEEYSQGRIDVEVYYASQLGGNTESMEGLREGTIESTELALTAISAYSDIWSTFSLPYMWDSGAEAIKAISSDNIMEILQADVKANNMMIIAWQDLGSRSVLNSKRPINTPADMKGLRIRVIQDPTLVDSINAMGGAAVALGWGECYSALEQGTIDGLENSTPLLTASSMQEVAKYYSLTEQFIMPDPVLISLPWFESLPADLQEAVVAAGEAYTKVWNEEIWPGAEEAALKDLIDAGVQVNEVDKDAFFEATQSVRDDFLANGSEDQVALFNALMAAKG